MQGERRNWVALSCGPSNGRPGVANVLQRTSRFFKTACRRSKWPMHRRALKKNRELERCSCRGRVPASVVQGRARQSPARNSDKTLLLGVADGRNVVSGYPTFCTDAHRIRKLRLRGTERRNFAAR